MMTIPTQSVSPVFQSRPLTTTTTGAIKPGHNQKDRNMIIAEIPREVTFDLPQGRYRAKISGLKPSIKQAGQGPQNWIKIQFDVQIPGMSERIDTRAGRPFKLEFNPGSELRNWLSGLLGKEFFRERSGQQVSLDWLLNTECEVELEHFYGKGYDKPLVVVASIHPVSGSRPATLTVPKGKD